VSQKQVFLYYYDPSNDPNEPSGIASARRGLTAVERPIQSEDTIGETIRLLIRGELSSEERARGLQTEFPLAGLALEGVRLTDGVLTLAFVDPLRRTCGGAGRVSILWSQIEMTAMQFPEVRRVMCESEVLFQP
jgi:spore germination protein GerM